MAAFTKPTILNHIILRDRIVGLFQTRKTLLFSSCYMLDTVAGLSTHSPCSKGAQDSKSRR